jgi:erythromycin esterase-like protein
MTESCERAVLDQLHELRRRAGELAGRDGGQDPDELFFAEQNARLVTNAERYYRAMFGGRSSAWNLRDQHMAETLEALASLLASRGRQGPIVVWAHNSHLGDARATEMGTAGELNVGQLVRKQHPDDSLLLGFTTYDGTVTAAEDWDGPAERMTVRPGRSDSYEGLFHEVNGGDFLIDLRDIPKPLPRRLERAIGVIYRPETERQSHYFEASLSRQFDIVLHLDHTRALEPMERSAAWEAAELPETYPSGL